MLRPVVGGGGVLPAAGAAGRRRARGARCDWLLPAVGRFGEAGRVRLGAAASRAFSPHRIRAADRDRPRDPPRFHSCALAARVCCWLVVGVRGASPIPCLMNCF